MSKLGMDIEAAEGFARTLENQALNEVSSVLTGMSGLVSELMTVWKGPDATLFEQNWSQQAKNLTLLHGAVNDLLGSLQQAIKDQRTASAS